MPWEIEGALKLLFSSLILLFFEFYLLTTPELLSIGCQTMVLSLQMVSHNEVIIKLSDYILVT